jgi:hypothetical protein
MTKQFDRHNFHITYDKFKWINMGTEISSAKDYSTPQ